MQAGRELDQMIAERVMGWTREDRPQGPGPFWWTPFDSHGAVPASAESIPHFSTNISAAWLVVDEFARRRIPVSLYSMSHGIWFCFFGSPPILDASDPTRLTHEVRANTPAEAICRAALAVTPAAAPHTALEATGGGEVTA